MPLLIIGAVLGLLSTIFLIAYLSIKNKKEVLGFDRNMKDTVIIKRLLSYAKPYYKSFIVVFLLMAFV
jgi:ATP-binding cassette subfamily B protein